MGTAEFARFAGQATEAVAVLRSLAHEARLLVLCYLAEVGKLSVGQLVDRIGLSQSALSQHLAKLRAERLVATRKSAQTVYYRVAEPRTLMLLATLHKLYCPALGQGEKEVFATLSKPNLILPALQVNMRAGHLPPPEELGVRYFKLPLDVL